MSSRQYEKRYKKGIFKYIPKKLRFKIRPKMLSYIRDRNGNIKGKALGVFSTHENLSEKDYIEGIVKGVKKCKEEETNSLVLEELTFINENILRNVEEYTNLKIVDGKKVRIIFLPFVLKELFLEIGKESIDYEVLIIGENQEELRFLIKELSNMIKFLAVYMEDKESFLKIKEDVLMQTGLAIYCTKDIDKMLANYYIIINLNNNISIDVDKLRYKSIVFDFSSNQKIARNIKEKNKKVVVIEDYVFKNNFYLDNDFIKLDKMIPSRLYQMEDRFNEQDFKGLIVNSKCYSVKKLVQEEVRLKEKL